MSKTKIDTSAISAIVNAKEIKSDMYSEKLNKNREIQNTQFEEVCKMLGVTWDSKCNQYREIKTNKFVKRTNLFPVVDDNSEVKPEISYNESPTGINIADEDIMKPLPDYSKMGLEEMLSFVVYNKNQVDHGIVTKYHMKDINGNLIPVKKPNDGSERGYNRWSSQSPEEMFVNRAAYWADKIIEYMGQTELERLDAMIGKHATIADAVTQVIDIANMFQEDYVEKAQNKYVESKRKFDGWLINIFGRELAIKVKRNIKVELDKKVAEALNTSSNMEEVFKISGSLSKSGQWEDENKRRWIDGEEGPMVMLTKAIKQHLNGRISGTQWKEVAAFFQVYFWYYFKKLDSIETARDSKMYAIKQYMYASFSIISMEARKEQQTRDAGIDADPPWKTNWDDRFQKDNVEWAWENFKMDFED